MRDTLKPEILYLNNSTQELARAELFGSVPSLFDIKDYWAYGNKFPDFDEDFAGVFISGSPHSSYDDDSWIEKEHKLITHLANRGVPLFGICFGSQILASALCGHELCGSGWGEMGCRFLLSGAHNESLVIGR